MTQEEINNYNCLCAKFLDAIYSEHAEAWGFGNAKNIGSKMFHGVMYHNVIQAERFEKELKFHSDWNWIMEVCIAIKNIQNPREHSDTTCSTLKREIQSYLGSANKEAVVEAINQFLIWYEQNRKS
jgi:hypothetical protein